MEKYVGDSDNETERQIGLLYSTIALISVLLVLGAGSAGLIWYVRRGNRAVEAELEALYTPPSSPRNLRQRPPAVSRQSSGGSGVADPHRQRTFRPVQNRARYT